MRVTQETALSRFQRVAVAPRWLRVCVCVLVWVVVLVWCVCVCVKTHRTPSPVRWAWSVVHGSDTCNAGCSRCRCTHACRGTRRRGSTWSLLFRQSNTNHIIYNQTQPTHA